MASIRTVAAKNVRWQLQTEAPEGPTVAAASAGFNASCDIAAAGSSISASASDKITDPAMCEDTNNGAFGTGNYEGSIAPFILIDSEDGTYDLADNPVFEALKVKNTIAYLVVREGVAFDADFAAGQLVSAYQIRTDVPQRPAELSGYIKRNIPLDVTPLFENAVLTA